MATVLFLQRDSYEVFGVMYLSASISQKGHRAEVLIETEEGRNFFSKISEIKPDIVAFSIMSGLHDWAAKTAAEVKQRFNYHIIAGGPHCTFFPEFVEMEGIDAVCRGDVEDALAEYLTAFDKGDDLKSIAGWWSKTNKGIIKNDVYQLRADLDTLPYPDRDIYRRRYDSLNSKTCCEILVARGCPYNCSFCHNQLLRDLYNGKGRYIRRHTIQRVIDEIMDLKQRYGNTMRWVSFVDDLFIMDRKWLKDFLNIYKKDIALPFGCGLRANLIDEELVAMLAEGGCRVASFGVESGDSELRNAVLNKKLTDEQIITAGSILNKHGIRFSTFNMFNLPGETLEKAEKTVLLNLKIRSGNYPWSGLLQPYRGTAVYDHADKLGMIAEGETGANLFHNATIRQKDTEMLEELNSYFYWMIRYPLLMPILMWFVRHPVALLSKISRLITSFHRYVSLMYPFEGSISVLKAVKSGLKRIKAYA